MQARPEAGGQMRGIRTVSISKRSAGQRASKIRYRNKCQTIGMASCSRRTTSQDKTVLLAGAVKASCAEEEAAKPQVKVPVSYEMV